MGGFLSTYWYLIFAELFFVYFYSFRAFKLYLPIRGRVDRASATETVDLGSIPVGSNQKLSKLVIIASLLDVQQLKEQCEASTVCGREVGRWQLDSKTKRFLRCLLPKATWWIKYNYNYDY